VRAITRALICSTPTSYWLMQWVGRAGLVHCRWERVFFNQSPACWLLPAQSGVGLVWRASAREGGSDLCCAVLRM